MEVEGATDVLLLNLMQDSMASKRAYRSEGGSMQ